MYDCDYIMHSLYSLLIMMTWCSTNTANLSVTTISLIKFITCDLFNNVF